VCSSDLYDVENTRDVFFSLLEKREDLSHEFIESIQGEQLRWGQSCDILYDVGGLLLIVFAVARIGRMLTFSKGDDSVEEDAEGICEDTDSNQDDDEEDDSN
jgi:hypothetical protein